MKPIKHLNETDPAKVALSEEIFARSFELAKAQAPQLVAAMNVQRGFLLNVYDEHLGMVEAIIEKYSEYADLAWRYGYHHLRCGPVIVLGFRVHEHVDLLAMMSGKLGVTFPDD